MLEFQTYGDGEEARAYIAPEHVAAVISGGISTNGNPYCYAIVGGERVVLAGTARQVGERIAYAKGVGIVP